MEARNPVNAVTDAERFADYKKNPTIPERNALAEFYLPDCQKLSLYIFRRFGRKCQTLKDEFMGEAQITLLTAVEQYDPERHDRFSIFLYVCLIRRLKRLCRIQDCRKDFAAVGTAEDEYTPEPEDYRKAEPEHSDLLSYAEKFMGKEIVRERFVNGMTLEQVGAILGVSRSTILNRIHMFAEHYKRKLIDVA